AEGVAAIGGAEDGAAEVGDAAHLVGAERHQTGAVVESVVAAPDADTRPTAIVGGQHDRPDHRVEAGSIPAASRDGYAHKWGNRSMLFFKDAPLPLGAAPSRARRQRPAARRTGPFARSGPAAHGPGTCPGHGLAARGES